MGCGASSDKYRPGIEVELAPELGLSGREADTVKKQLARQALLAELPKNKLVHVVSGLMSLPWKVKDGTALAEQGESPATAASPRSPIAFPPISRTFSRTCPIIGTHTNPSI